MSISKHEAVSLAENMISAAEMIKKFSNETQELLNRDPTKTILELKSELEKVKSSLKEAEAYSEELRQRNYGQGQKLRGIRKNLNGSGKDLVTLAEEVFLALKKLDPNHPLVTYDVGKD